MDQHVSDKHVAEHIPEHIPINSNSSLSDLLLEDNKKTSKNISKVPVSQKCPVILGKILIQNSSIIPNVIKKELETEPKFEIKHQKNQGGNPRKFVCEVCLCSFSTPAAIAAHLATHGGTETFKCRLCGKSYIPTTNSKTNKDCGSLPVDIIYFRSISSG